MLQPAESGAASVPLWSHVYSMESQGASLQGLGLNCFSFIVEPHGHFQIALGAYPKSYRGKGYGGQWTSEVV